MTDAPASRNAARVPRSRIDDRYDLGEPLPEIRVGAGQVVSIDGVSATVLMFGEEIPGVVWFGENPPTVGSTVAVESRGDLLIIPDTFETGTSYDAAHVVSETFPNEGPGPIEVNVGGSMRDVGSWSFDVNAHGWRSELSTTDVGIRAWQAPGTLQSRNLLPTPSFETGLGLWQSSTVGGTMVPATLAQDSSRYAYGTKSLRVTWPDIGVGDGAVAVHPPIALDPAKRWIVSMLVYIPEGAPTVRAIALDGATGPEITAREQWVWTSVEFTPPADGNGAWVGVWCSDPVAASLCWVDAVVLRDAATDLPSDLGYFDGSLANAATRSFAWEGTAHNSVSDWYDGQLGTPTTGILWSTLPFDVDPYRTIALQGIATKNAGADGNVKLTICYSPDATRDPDPLTDPVIPYGGAATPIPGQSVAWMGIQQIPATLPDGVSVPRRARIGIQLNGPGTSDLTLDSVKVTTTTTWPIGSLWLNPAVGQALPTIGSTVTTGLGGSGAGDITDTSGSYARVPNTRKALVTAPPDTGGYVWFLHTWGYAANNSNGVVSAFQTAVDGATASGTSIIRVNNGTLASLSQVCSLTAWAVLAPGQTCEAYLTHNYPSAPGANKNSMRQHSMLVVFVPTGVQAGASYGTAPLSYWDGNSWRPDGVFPATMDLTKDGTSVEPGKTASATALSASSSDVHAGALVTLSAVVSPGGGGSVTFYSSPNLSGPWVSLGAVTVAGGLASKQVTPKGSTTTYYRATYGGNVTYAPSTSPNVPIRSRTLQTTVFNLPATWAQAYNADGTKVVEARNTAVHQGVDQFDGKGNRRSLLRFAQVVPTGTGATIARVTLVCDKWDYWKPTTDEGTLIAGWHRSNGGAAPATYPTDLVSTDLQRITKSQGSWRVNMTAWADVVVTRTDFGGITVGPGPGPGDQYVGWSHDGAPTAATVAAAFHLEVEFTSWI